MKMESTLALILSKKSKEIVKGLCERYPVKAQLDLKKINLNKSEKMLKKEKITERAIRSKCISFCKKTFPTLLLLARNGTELFHDPGAKWKKQNQKEALYQVS